MLHYFALNKPHGCLSQFSSEDGHPGLSSLKLNLPTNVWPVGRLDKDSEGLLLLSSDMRWKNELTNPENLHKKKYWVQVEGIPTQESLRLLNLPMELRINKKVHLTKAAIVREIAAPLVSERTPLIRYRANIPTSWLEFIIVEGKNRQIRRMTAKMGHPTLRLIRAQIGELKLNELKVSSGQCVRLNQKQIDAALA